ncbi:MAG: hypothetical protein GXO31_04615 [Epsilonproteobacteria bacterium]|nr:hypothetical protein [Campylobacterota bacterium]
MIKTISTTLLIKILLLFPALLFSKTLNIEILPLSTKLSALYKIDKKENGYDITYLFKNNLRSPQKIPDIKIGYINLSPKKYIYVLNTANFLNLTKRKPKPKILINESKELYYPISYSPVIVAADDKKAVAAAVLTNFPKDRWALGGEIHKTKKGYIFVFTNENKKILKPNEEFKTVISVREANKKDWLSALKPYKEYFNSTFTKNPPKKDLQTILGIDLSYIGAAGEIGNERGYNSHTRLDLYGLNGKNPKYHKTFLKGLIDYCLKNKIKRVMLWAISGEYFKNCKRKHCFDTNYPPQFMSNLPPKIKKSIDLLKTLNKYGISYGFWWGRSGEVPIKNAKILQPNQWNPQKVIPLNPLEKNHLKFALREIDLAVKRGAKEIGLDAYARISPSFQIKWLKFLKERYPNVKFWVEGVMSDYLHTQASLFLQPKNGFFNPSLSPVTSPPLLASYLNPDSEIILYLKYEPDKKYIQKTLQLGFSPLITPYESNIFRQ